MNRLTRIIAIATVAAVPLVGLTATPAGAKTVPAAQWMSKFCTIYGDWSATIQQASEEVQSLAATSDGSDLVGAKNALVDMLSQSIDATESAIDDLEAAGIPNAPNGKKIQATILTSLKQGGDVFEDAEAAAEELDTTDPVTFVADTSEVSDDISVGLDKAFAGLAKIDKLDKSKTFKKLSDKTKSCQALDG